MSQRMGHTLPGNSNRINNLSTTAQKILSENGARVGYFIQNLGSADVYFGSSNVTGSGSTTGLKLSGGQTPADGIGVTIDYGEVWVVCPSGTGDVTIVEYQLP